MRELVQYRNTSYNNKQQAKLTDKDNLVIW